MKAPLFIIGILLTTCLAAQDYCTHNSQTVVNFGTDAVDTPSETIELENGKYIIIGTSNIISSNELFTSVCRMNEDDSLDPTFGENGRVSHNWGDRNSGTCGALQSDGKILVGGNQSPGSSSPDIKPYVGRLNPDGSKDESFGELGSAMFNFQTGLKGTVVGMRELQDGKILVAIVTQTPLAIGLVRLNTDGSCDTSFNGNGYIIHSDSRILWQVDYGTALFLSDGSVSIVNKSLTGGALRSLVFKLNADGTLDSNFGEGGSMEIATPVQGNSADISAALDNDENILVATTSESTPKKYQVAKVFGDTGLLDTDFGDNGVAFSSNTDGFNSAADLIVDPSNGDIYTVGTSSTSNWNNSVWKINSLGLEQDVCSGSAMYLFPAEGSDGLHTIDIFSDGSFKFVGESTVDDESTPDTSPQYVNFAVSKFEDTSGLNEIAHSDLSIYPNPAYDYVNIEVNDLFIESISVRNQLGQIVLSSFKIDMSLDINQLTPGIYFVQINTSKGVALRKLIKQ